VVKGPTWLHVSLVIAASCVSAWIPLQMVQLYWRDFLAWLLSETGPSCSPSPSAPRPTEALFSALPDWRKKDAHTRHGGAHR
jgi:hypothetical protein